MGRSAKQRRSSERKKIKANEKAQRKALYQSYGDKRRAKDGIAVKSASSKKGQHPEIPCGNPACKRCYVKT